MPIEEARDHAYWESVWPAIQKPNRSGERPGPVMQGHPPPTPRQNDTINICNVDMLNGWIQMHMY